MKVLMMAKSFYPVIGGVERTVYELARGLNRYYDITLLTVSEDRRFREESFDGIKVIKTPRFAKILSTPMSFNYPLWFKKLSINTDLIHLHSPHPVGELVLNTFPTYTKILTTYHFDIVKQSYLKWLYSPLLKTVFRKSQKIVTSNPNIIQTSSLLEDYQDKCIAIPFGIKISEYLLSQEQLKNALALKNKYSKPVILFVGRLVYYKGVEFLIKAMARIDANLIIIGEGPLRKRLGVLVNNLGIANKVEFIDHLPREDLLLYFNICDVFVLPSVARSEGFGMVLLEAMAYSKPLVTTELGTGTSFINIDGETGFVVPAKNPDALSQAINKLIIDKNMRKEMGENAFMRLKLEFTFEKYVLNYKKLYEEILK